MQTQATPTLTPPTPTPAQLILAQFDTYGIKAALLQAPAEIAAARGAESVARANLDEARQALALREAGLSLEINLDKAKYPNEGARAAALTQTKAADEEYLKLTAWVRQGQNALDNAQITLRAIEDRFSGIKTVARLVTAELTLLAGDQAE